MKALLCLKYGNPESLQFQEIGTPAINDNQVLIELRACGVNFPDQLIIQGKYQFKPPFPFSPGGEISGIITKIGKKVSQFSVGTRVMALSGWGGFAEQVAVDASRVFPIPDTMDWLVAASTLYTYGTSLYALQQKAAIKKGDTILVLGAAGGVGLAAVELAKLFGATVIACASTPEKLNICKCKGADFIINYKAEDLKESIKTITNNKGVDIVFDTVGGELADLALGSIAWKGRYLVIGFATGSIPQFPLNIVLLKGCSIQGVFWGSFAEKEVQENLKNVYQILELLGSGKIKQHIHKIYPLENAAEALRDLQDKKVIGKAIVTINESEEKILENIKSSAIENENSIPELSITPTLFKDKTELKKNIGKSLGKTDWLCITQDRINQFADATLDFQWVHTDTEKAKLHLPQGKTIAHGYLTMSLASQFFYQLISFEKINSFINYGINKGRFISPVQVGSFIRMIASISNVEEMPNGSVKLFLHCSIEIKGHDKPAYVAEVISMIF